MRPPKARPPVCPLIPALRATETDSVHTELLGDVVVLLIEEVCEVQTVAACERVFAYLDARKAELTKVAPPAAQAHRGSSVRTRRHRGAAAAARTRTDTLAPVCTFTAFPHPRRDGTARVPDCVSLSLSAWATGDAA
jgi:hypothetical protein